MRGARTNVRYVNTIESSFSAPSAVPGGSALMR